MESLDLNAILDDTQIDSLFGSEEIEESSSEEEDNATKQANDKKSSDTTEVDAETLFEDSEGPESVGGEVNGEDADSIISKGSSPEFFSSIANAFAEEGIFPDLDDETIKNIKTAKDFKEAINAQIKAGFDEQQKRILDALDGNVQSDTIRQHENLKSYLNSIDDATLSEESEAGENLRKKILYQDFVNRGFSKERAIKAVERAVNNGTDIDDAREALDSVKEFCEDEYKQVLENSKKQKKQQEEESKKRIEEFKKTMLEDNISFFDGVELSKSTRQVAYDAVTKPVYKDPNTGEYLTAVQKLQREDYQGFLSKVGLIYALTDGFKNLDGLVKTKVKKEVKKGFDELESKINNTRRDSSGNLKFASGVDDSDSYFGKGITLDI